MTYLKQVNIYFWSANHIALQVTQSNPTYTHNTYKAEYDEEGALIQTERFRALTHDSDTVNSCTSRYFPDECKDIINTWYDNRRHKKPSIIEDYWEDCAQYIREDQVELLKLLFQVMLSHNIFDDDEDFEDSYDDDIPPESLELAKQLGVQTISNAEKRYQSLIQAEKHCALQSLVDKLQENKTPLEKKYIILDFVEHIKTQKGLAINLENLDDEETMYGKLPVKQWSLPLGNSMTLDDKDEINPEHVKLFGLNVRGIENGIKKFEDAKSLIHRGYNEVYYKYFSRYHNCAGYSRFLLEQGGITAFCSTNSLETLAVTNPSLYDYYMNKVETMIIELNRKSQVLMKNAGIVPKPLDYINRNYLGQFTDGMQIFDELPKAVRKEIKLYNQQLIMLSYEYKINLLAEIVNGLYHYDITQPELIDALQKEVRRNYELQFDSQFSHHHSFQLKCLSGLLSMGIATLTVGIIAIVCPALIPISSMVAIMVTSVAATIFCLSLAFLIEKMQPRIPSNDHGMIEDNEFNPCIG